MDFQNNLKRTKGLFSLSIALLLFAPHVFAKDIGKEQIKEKEQSPFNLSSKALNKVEADLRARLFDKSANDLIVEFVQKPASARAMAERAADPEAALQAAKLEFRTSKESVLATLNVNDYRLLRDYDALPMAFVRIKNRNALLQLLNNSSVKAVHENKKHRHTLVESLPLIKQPQAAGAGHQGLGTTVAVLDTGADYTRAAFGPCTVPGTPAGCRVVAALDTAPQDNSLDAHGHGTNVSGIVAGVGPANGIAAIDVFDGSYASSTDIIAGINWAIKNQKVYNIVAMNLSLGDGSLNTTECPSSWAATPFSNARAAGIIPVVAAGNEKRLTGVADPACAPGAVRVGAVYDANMGGIKWSSCADDTTAADQVTCFSNSGDVLTLFAPGALIDAAGIQMGGTSQAAPHVAGAVSVLRAPDALPSDTLGQTISRLTISGPVITDHRNNVQKPRLDLDAALNSTLPPCTSSNTALSIDVPASGALAITDCDSKVRAGSYYDNFTFTPTTGATYYITLASSAIDAYLYLLDSNGQALASNDNFDGTDATIAYTATASGPLTIHATSYHAAATGAYNVTVRSTPPCSSSITPLNSDGTVNGDLAATDCRSPVRPGSYADNFTFSAIAGATYTITLDSGAFDTVLFLLNASGQVLASNDDIAPPSNTNSRITYTATSSETLTIHATSFDDVATGAYSVTISGIPVDATPPVVTPNVNGALGSNGWYTSDVTVSWTVSDLESPVTSQTGCATVTLTSDTAGTTYTCSATSTGGTTAQSVTVKRDTVAPAVAVTGVAAGAIYAPGSVPTAACSSNDMLSGVQTAATATVSGGVNPPTAVGTYTATCAGALDQAGNHQSAPDTAAFTIASGMDLTGSWQTPFNGSLAVRNIGNQNVGLLFFVSVYLSTDGIQLGQLVQMQYVWGLAAGTVKTLSFPNVDPGKAGYLIAVIDSLPIPLFSVPEINENNNRAVIPLS